MRSVIKTIFKPQEPPRKGEESESEESVEKKGQPYKPFHPFAQCDGVNVHDVDEVCDC